MSLLMSIKRVKILRGTDVKIRSMKWNQVASNFLLGLLGSAPILLLSSTAQAGANPNKQIPTEAIQKVAIQSVYRAVLARQELSSYPDSLAPIKQLYRDNKTAGRMIPPAFLER
jgi:hypothetical protein